MSIFKVDGSLFKQMIINGAVNLDNNCTKIDELNVFPVPDGDTGTNMKLTLKSGVKEIQDLNTNSISEIAKKLSRGLLMGARGNSGVILSQLFRGFASGVEGHDVADAVVFAKALKKGMETAYKAVMKPVEGTILTVARESAEEMCRIATPELSLKDFLARLVYEANRSLQKTPDLLPILKEVGVIDSGGKGLLVIYEGFEKAVNGEVLTINENAVVKEPSAQSQFSIDDITFGYCTEFIVQLDNERLKSNPFTEERLINALAKIGDSLVVVQDEDIVKVHVHTNEPGVALNLAQKYGEFLTLKIENMREQHSSIVEHEYSQPAQPKEMKEYGIIAVCSGEGLSNIFKEMGCDYIITGGQTMNPSTEDFLKAIKEVHARNVIILPNNSNIIMAANQAADNTEDVEVRVIPSKTIPQGYSSLLIFNPTTDIDENFESMSEQAKEVKSGQVTFAVRNTQYNGLEIKKDDYMGIFDKDIVVSKPNRLDVTLSLLDQMIDDLSEIVTVFYGDDVTEEEVMKITEYIEKNHRDVELEVLEGNQPVYSYIIAIE